VHDQLDSAATVSRFDAPRHLRSLALEIARFFDRPIELRLELGEELVLDVSQAVPLSLLLTELLTNAYRHAFPNGKTGKVLIELRSTEGAQVALVVSDDGVGMGWAPPTGLGLGIADSLARQLGGRLELRADAGLHARVKFPLKREATSSRDEGLSLMQRG
jgi:two-component sensor histidine kinase